MATVIDPQRSLNYLQERLNQTTNERHRVVLAAVIKHARLEAGPVWDVDQLLTTLTPNPNYHVWVNGVDFGPKGADAVRAFYNETNRSRTTFVEVDFDRVVVDERCAVLEGFLKQIYPGAHAALLGMTVDDPDADYLVVFRSITVVRVDEGGLIEGEDAYLSGPASVTKLSREDLPPEYAATAHISG